MIVILLMRELNKKIEISLSPFDKKPACHGRHWWLPICYKPLSMNGERNEKSL